MTGSIRGVVGFVLALLPIAYFGGLIYYFVGVGGGSMEGVVDIGLGPTVLGLTIVGLLIAMPAFVKLIRFMSGMNRNADRVAKDGLSVGDLPPLTTDGFDADAALANYMSKRGEAPIAPDDASISSPPQRAQFGRRLT